MTKEDKQGYEFLMDRECESECGIYRRYMPNMDGVSLELHIDGIIRLDEDILDEIDGIFMTAMDQLNPFIKEAERRIYQRAKNLWNEHKHG